MDADGGGRALPAGLLGLLNRPIPTHSTASQFTPIHGNPFSSLEGQIQHFNAQLHEHPITLHTEPAPTPHAVPLIPLLRGVATKTEAPQTAYQMALLHGTEPPKSLRTGALGFGPHIYDAIANVARQSVAQKEGIHADPLAEAVISTLATAGLGAGANLLRSGAEGAVGAAGAAGAAETGSAVSDVHSAADVLRGLRTVQAAKAAPAALRALPATLAERGAAGLQAVREIPGAIEGLPAATRGAVQAAPGALKGAATDALSSLRALPMTAAERATAFPQALRDEAQGLTTAEGRRLAAARGLRGAEGGLYAHPLVGGAGLLAGAHRAGIEIPGAKVADALISGHINALLNNPGGTALTTGRSLAGAIAAPVALGTSALDSATQLNPQPFLHTAGTQIGGLRQIANELLSGNPKTVQKSVEHNVGLSLVAPLPAIGRLDSYERLRSAAREAAATGRDAFTERTGIPTRHGPGEQHIFGHMERRAQRMEIAKMAQRSAEPEANRAAHWGSPIVKAARKVPGARALGNVRGLEPADFIQTMAEYGIRRPEQFKLLEGLAGTEARPGDVNLRAVLDHVAEHPEIVSHPKLQEAVQRYAENVKHLPAQEAGMGDRAAALPQAALFGIRPPEERTPFEARPFTGVLDRAGAWEDLKGREKAAEGLRREGMLKRAEAGARAHISTSPRDEHALAATAMREEAKGKYLQARQLEEHNRGFRNALDPYSRPGAAVSAMATRHLWDKPLLKEFVDETHAAASAHGLEPGIWTHHAPLRQEGEIAQGTAIGNSAASIQHVRRSPTDPESLAYRDVVDRSFHGLLRGSVEGPRQRAASQAFAREFFTKNAQKAKLADGTSRRIVTQGEFAHAIHDGQFSEKDYVWMPVRQGKQAYLDPNVTTEKLAAEGHAAIKGELGAQAKGTKGFIVPKESAKEYVAQIDPAQNVASKLINAASKSAGRTLLASPAWVLSQIVAHGTPALMANPGLLNPLHVAKLEKRMAEHMRVSPDEALGYAATFGESKHTALTGTPRDAQPQFSPTQNLFYNGARAIEHTAVGRGMFSLARLRPTVMFNQWRAGHFQKLLATAEIDKRFNGSNGFLPGLQGMLHTEKGLAAELRQMSPMEVQHAIMQPRFKGELDKIRRYQENVLGNWTAFTRYERAFAPMAIFYGFIRYAFRWPFTFAKEHPGTAQLDYFLSQQNSNQIEKILGKPPAEFEQFANPVVQDAHGASSWLPSGTRITPGLSGAEKGILGGSAPSGIVGSMNPFLAAATGLVTGTTSFGTQDKHPGAGGLHWSLAKEELMSLPPLLRFAGIGQSNSSTSQQIRADDPNKALRSFVLPSLPQGAAGAKRTNDLITSLNEGTGSSGGGRASSTPVNPFKGVLGGSSASGSSNPFKGLIP